MATPRHRTHERDAEHRRCILTGEVLPKSALIRFVVGPGDEVVPDLDERLPGRGLWLQARRDIMRRASAEDTFSRAARKRVTVPADLADRVAALLRRRCLDLIGLGRRGGGITAGFEQVRERLAAGAVGVLLQASDGAEGGRAKMRTLAGSGSRRQSGSGGPPVIAQFTAAELGQALGRDHVVHAALDDGPLAVKLCRQAARLAALMGPDGVPGNEHPAAA